MNKFFLVRMDAIGNSFPDMKAGKKIKFKIEIQDGNNILENISKDDIVVGVDELGSPQISTIFKVLEKNSGDTIILQKIVEAYPGCKITSMTTLKEIKDNIILEITRDFFNNIYNALIPKLSPDENMTSNEDLFLQVKSGKNTLFYGVPGSGKSHSVDEMTAGKPSKRVVFHPDYTNSDFVGQILPGLDENGDLEYRFTPGPFTDILLAALITPSVHHYLIIEEINRGNAPAIFGEVFQLLDRNDNGESRYGIINNEVLKYLNDKLEDAGKAEIVDIKIPGNLSILATMNTSDQNVFTIDTAFQRRWNMKYVKNNFDENEDANKNIAGSQITWKAFGEVVNDVLADVFTGIGSAEDKGLGAFFAKKEEITDAEKFGEKVLKYLWDDAFKMDRETFFNIGDGRKKLQHFLEEFERPTVVEGVPVDSLKFVVKPEVFEKMCNK